LRKTGPSAPSTAAFRPLAVSAILASAYVVLCGSYIFLSDRIAARMSDSVAALLRIELTKGIAFILVTGAAFFAFSYALLRRIASQEERIIRQQTALLESEGRAMAGIFAASVGHDMNNLLTVADGSLHRLNLAATEAGAAEGAALKGVVADLGRLALRLMTIGRAGTQGEWKEFDLAELARVVVDLARSHKTVFARRVETSLPESAKIFGNPVLVGRALMNLVLNAAEATGKGGRIEVRVESDGSTARLEVHDDGPGVPEEARETIFDAFHSTKPEGTGLGLLSVKVCAEQHGGSVDVSRSGLGGALFRIGLPLRGAPRK